MVIARPNAVAGSTPQVPLEIHKGGDLNFDLRWWSDETRVQPVYMSEARAQVRSSTGELILDLAPMVVENRVVVRVPAAVTAAILHRGMAEWDCEVVAAVSGETKKLAKGRVQIFEEVTQ